MLSREGVTGLVCLAGSLALLAATWGLPGPTLLVPVGPGFYPRIILGITIALSVALVVIDLAAARQRAARAKPAPSTENYGLVAGCFAIFGLYIAVLPLVGFRLSTLAFLVALQAAMDPPRDRRRWIVIGIVALITTVLTYFLFERYLLVLLPRGRWTDF